MLIELTRSYEWFPDMKRLSLVMRLLKRTVVYAISLSLISLILCGEATHASKYSCGTYGAGTYQSSDCPKKGLFAPSSGVVSSLIVILAVVSIGAGISLFLGTKRRADDDGKPSGG